MNRYILRFYKHGNMRFISHLDLQTLFQRAIKRGEVKAAYSNGYNPHELMNIVQPLSLGFEGEEELLELDTLISYEPEDLIKRLNLALPEGIKFFSCEETERKNQSTSCPTKSAEYTAVFNENVSQNLRLKDFLEQSEITVLKRDKKTKSMVEKDVKAMIIDIKTAENSVYLNLACGSNSTVNPLAVLKSLFSFSCLEFNQEECRITRIKLNRA